jgi:hypothetical protein
MYGIYLPLNYSGSVVTVQMSIKISALEGNSNKRMDKIYIFEIESALFSKMKIQIESNRLTIWI